MLSIKLLGEIVFTIDGQPVAPLRSRTATALLIYLLCQQRPYSRDYLAAFFWPDRETSQALANLRTALKLLRPSFADHLIITRQTVAFDPESAFWLDTAEFNRFANDPSPQNHQEALALYNGNFLEGFHLPDCMQFEEWSILERERLQRLAINGLHWLAADCLQNGRYPQGLQYTDKLLHLDDLSEQAHRLKMELLARNGRRSAALQQYNTCRQLLTKELDVEPAPATQQLYQRLRDLTLPPPHNLPSEPTPFLGREDAIVEGTSQLLSAETRLLTIIGHGGIGKTRLAVKIAQDIVQQHAGRFLDGVFFVPLAATKTPEMIPFRIAEAVGLAFQGTDAPQQQLLTHLHNKEMLLMADNLEHLLTSQEQNAATLFADILKQAPDVTLLVTSRERLQLYEETLYTISGLALPPNAAPQPEIYSAVALFLQRVQRLQHGFTPSPEEMAAIVRVCHLLDGSPLAIELAAGWIMQHSCQTIAAETEASLEFLRTTFHNVPARQRSLQAVFDHSWILLSPELQTVFAQLSIFPDTFTEEAAVSITGASSNDLMALLDKSLLQREANGRLHIHPLLQQFAAQKLDDSTQIVQQRHTDFYLDFLASQGSGESVVERAAIVAELPNIEAMWERISHQCDYGALDRAIPILHNFFSTQSWFQEGIDLFQLAITQITAVENNEDTLAQAQTLCELLGRKARMHIHIGQLAAANAALTEVTPYLHRLDDPDQRATIFSYSAITRFYAGDYAQATELAQESLRLALQTDNLDGISFACNFLGSCAKAQGNYEESQKYFEQAVTAYRQQEDEIGAGMVLHNLGNLAQARGDFTAAQSYYQACTDLFQANDYKQGAATALSNAGKLALQQKEYEQARHLLLESLTLKQDLHDERGMAVSLVGLGGVAVETGAYTEAHQQFTQAMELAQKCGDVKLSLEILVGTAALAIAEAREAEAAFLLAYILTHTGTVQEVRQHALQLSEQLTDFSVQDFSEDELKRPLSEIISTKNKGD